MTYVRRLLFTVLAVCGLFIVTAALGVRTVSQVAPVRAVVLPTCVTSATNKPGSFNYYQSSRFCSAVGPSLTLATEMETGTGGLACTQPQAPLFQSVGVGKGVQVSASGSTVRVSQDWTHTAPPCLTGAAVWSWVALLDHDTSATDDGVRGKFGDVQGTSLPPPQKATEALDVAFADYLNQPGQASTFFLDYGGIWGGCYNFIEVTLSDLGDNPPQGALAGIWRFSHYPAVSTGCMNYISLNGDYLLNGGHGYLPELKLQHVSIDWASVISWLQSQKGCPTPIGLAGCTGDVVPTGAVLPPYDKGAVTDIEGVAMQSMEQINELSHGGWGPAQTLEIRNIQFPKGVK